MNRTVWEMVREATDYVCAHTSYNPSAGIVLGSGLSPLAERMSEADIIDYRDIPYFPRSTVRGHSGRLLLGRLGAAQVLMMQGRVHHYEGYSMGEVALPVRVMRAMGVTTLIVTNSAGGIRPDLKPGDLMAITDHLNLVGLAGHNPLRGPNDERLGPRFPDMSRAYDLELLQLLDGEASAQGVALRDGVYAMVAGPNYETPAEIRFLRLIGADAVGMSTVPEVVAARHGGMRVLGISLISNVAIDSLDDSQKRTSHTQVLEAGQRAVPALAGLLEGVLGRLS